MKQRGLYQMLRRDLPCWIYRLMFDIYERERWERAVSRAWFRCQDAAR